MQLDNEDTGYVSISIINRVISLNYLVITSKYEGWNFNSGNYLFTTDTK